MSPGLSPRRIATPLLATLLLAAPTVVAVPTGPAEPRWLGGMLLEARGGRVVVAKILDGSVAARAGLEPGDAILVVGDRAVVDLDRPTPSEILRAVERIRGDTVRLVVGRGAGTLGVLLAARGPGATAAAGPAAPVIGGTAPGFEARAFDGRTVSLTALRGRPVLIDFWASWCPPCRDAALVVRRLADQHGGRLAIIGVSLDEKRDDFEAFVYNLHLPGDQVFDGGPRGPVTTLYGAAAAGLPFAVLIAPDGTVAATGRSPLAVEGAIERLLGAKDGPHP
jgi:cytochrome c biogenesis protein CcmG/thiol:disulfide interchange protein DsbE